ncbi:NAD-dependent protein deacetylase sirtuin-2 [Mortierella sp. AD010]|nr:NAD-dependent protein deacetylase sirtuin-2 [Mortierella sp. AD010]
MSSVVATRIPLKLRPPKPKPEPEPRIQILKDGTINAIADLIATGKAKNIIVMTGAGISTAAGIKDFRSPGTGLYDDLEKYNLPFPEAVFDLEFFKPTLTHYLLPLLAKKKLLLRSYTQNIDSLERLAGLDEDLLVEAHGSFAYSKCVQCEMTSDSEWVKKHIMDGEIPYCKRCSGLVKPSITFFGENVPLRFSAMADKDFDKCDLLIVLGTSLKVEPFNRLISKVSPRCPRLLINREKAGQDLHSGFDFDDKWKYTIQRDALFLGNCDDGVRELATLCGWADELQAMYDAGHRELKLKRETESTESLKTEDDNEDDDEDDTEKDDLDNEDESDKDLAPSSSDSLDDITHRLEQSIFFSQSQDSVGSPESKPESELKLEAKYLQSKNSDVGEENVAPVASTTQVEETAAVKESERKEEKVKGKNEECDTKSSEILAEPSRKDDIAVVALARVESHTATLETEATKDNDESSRILCATLSKAEAVKEPEGKEEKEEGKNKSKMEARREANDVQIKTHEAETLDEPRSTNKGTTKSDLSLKSKGSHVYSPMASLTDIESSNTLVTSLATSSCSYSPLSIATVVASSQQPFSTCVPVTAVYAGTGGGGGGRLAVIGGGDNGGSIDVNGISGTVHGIHGGGGIVGGMQKVRTKRRKEFENVHVGGSMKSGHRYVRENILAPHYLACGRVAKRRRVM